MTLRSGNIWQWLEASGTGYQTRVSAPCALCLQDLIPFSHWKKIHLDGDLMCEAIICWQQQVHRWRAHILIIHCSECTLPGWLMSFSLCMIGFKFVLSLPSSWNTQIKIAQHCEPGYFSSSIFSNLCPPWTTFRRQPGSCPLWQLHLNWHTVQRRTSQRASEWKRWKLWHWTTNCVKQRGRHHILRRKYRLRLSLLSFHGEPPTMAMILDSAESAVVSGRHSVITFSFCCVVFEHTFSKNKMFQNDALRQSASSESSHDKVALPQEETSSHWACVLIPAPRCFPSENVVERLCTRQLILHPQCTTPHCPPRVLLKQTHEWMA